MTTASQKMIQAIEKVVKQVGVGTNRNIFNLLWAMVTGAFLSSRGTVHLALKLSGCTDAEIRRASNALRTGKWQIGELISNWREYVEQGEKWQLKTYEGWHVMAADAVVFPRPKLKSWVGKLYRGTFGKAVKAVGIGVITDIGHYSGERVPLVRKLVRSQNSEESGKQLNQDMLKAVARSMGSNSVVVHDAGATIKDIRTAKIKNFVLRFSGNCVVRRSILPENPHGNRQYGDEIRPLARTRKGVLIESTNDHDFETSFEWEGRIIRAICWRDVVGRGDKVADGANQYDVWVFLIHVMQSLLFWEHQSKSRQKWFLRFTRIGGRSNRSHWWPNNELA